MATLIRKVARRPLWDRTAAPPPGIANDELAADALTDLKTTENRLSVFILDEGLPDAERRILAALAANGENLSPVTYASFDDSLLNDLGIELEVSPGDTLDAAVNATHRDLVCLTAGKLAALGCAIRRQATIGRKQPKVVKEIIAKSIADSHIDRAQLKPGIAAALFKESPGE